MKIDSESEAMSTVSVAAYAIGGMELLPLPSPFVPIPIEPVKPWITLPTIEHEHTKELDPFEIITMFAEKLPRDPAGDAMFRSLVEGLINLARSKK